MLIDIFALCFPISFYMLCRKMNQCENLQRHTANNIILRDNVASTLSRSILYIDIKCHFLLEAFELKVLNVCNGRFIVPLSNFTFLWNFGEIQRRLRKCLGHTLPFWKLSSFLVCRYFPFLYLIYIWK